ncbi:MAG: anaerobic ribonucleoside-triphosphate reductase activating protein [Aigarchaeota archaeon]|nr:anaerobic ribonucleoside-triphosphate reductase activating protein [Aigarchaeota archaeon]
MSFSGAASHRLELVAEEGDLDIQLGGFVDFSSVDWPSHVSFVVFFAGCNFRCPWCQNGDLVPVGSGRQGKLREIFGRLVRSIPVVEAVVATGGEPTLQPQALAALFRGTKKLGLSTFLDTNGSVPAVISDLAGMNLLDYVSVDLKARPEPGSYAKAIGLPPEEAAESLAGIWETVEACRRRGVRYDFRTTIVPGVCDTKRDVVEIAKRVAGAEAYWLQQFEPSPRAPSGLYRTMKPVKQHVVRELALAAAEAAPSTRVLARTRGNGIVEERPR